MIELRQPLPGLRCFVIDICGLLVAQLCLQWQQGKSSNSPLQTALAVTTSSVKHGHLAMSSCQAQIEPIT
jgi:hypothetical protein